MGTIDAMKQWLAALEIYWGKAEHRRTREDERQAESAITSLRKAIQEEALRNVQRIGQEIEQEKEIHDRHCNQGEWKGVCKYSDPNCPTIAELESQEPIYQYQLASGAWIDQTKESHDYNVRHGQATVRVLYTHPPQRTWVGLTDEEAQKTFAEHNCDISTHLAGILARAIEAKLKEKNT